MSVRYIPDRFLPDKAIDLLDEAAARLRLKIFTTPPEHRELEGTLKLIESEKAEAITEQNFEVAAALRDKERILRDEYDRLRLDWENRKSQEKSRKADITRKRRCRHRHTMDGHTGHTSA